MKTVKSVLAIALVVLTSTAFSTANAMTAKGTHPQGAATNASHKPVVKSTSGNGTTKTEGVTTTEKKTPVKKAPTKNASVKKATTSTKKTSVKKVSPKEQTVKTSSKTVKTTTTTTEKK